VVDRFQQPRAQCLNAHWFLTLDDAKSKMEEWRKYYNEERPLGRSGNVWDNAAMESFFSSLKTERAARKAYRTRNEAKADVFD
jgi:transposase InsO family protein